MDIIKIQDDPLDINEITELVTLPSCGAVSVFMGTTRDNFDQKKVVKLSYECYVPMAEKEIKKICEKVREKWNVGNIAVYHRLGEVPVKQSSVIIAISSEHRIESLQAVQFAIDSLKTSVPIWKKEIFDDDSSLWKQNVECKWTKEKLSET